MAITHKTHTMHGLSRHRIYSIYLNMKTRCSPTDYRHKRYSDRGITVCDEWLNSFEAFSEWAFSNGYAENLSLDRIDNDKGYFPENCRWATAKEQANNTRKNRLLTFNGETHTLSEWSDITGINHDTLCSRVKAGWDDVKVISTPVRRAMS